MKPEFKLAQRVVLGETGPHIEHSAVLNDYTQNLLSERSHLKEIIVVMASVGATDFLLVNLPAATGCRTLLQAVRNARPIEVDVFHLQSGLFGILRNYHEFPERTGTHFKINDGQREERNFGSFENFANLMQEFQDCAPPVVGANRASTVPALACA